MSADLPDPCILTPDERRRAVAAILAAALLRLRDRRALANRFALQKLPKSSAPSLASSPTAGLTVHAG